MAKEVLGMARKIIVFKNFSVFPWLYLVGLRRSFASIWEQELL